MCCRSDKWVAVLNGVVRAGQFEVKFEQRLEECRERAIQVSGEDHSRQKITRAETLMYESL